MWAVNILIIARSATGALAHVTDSEERSIYPLREAIKKKQAQNLCIVA